jgi:hypothetical protein
LLFQTRRQLIFFGKPGREMAFILVIPITGFSLVVLVVAFRLFVIIVMLIVTFAMTVALAQADGGMRAHEHETQSAGNHKIRELHAFLLDEGGQAKRSWK